MIATLLMIAWGCMFAWLISEPRLWQDHVPGRDEVFGDGGRRRVGLAFDSCALSLMGISVLWFVYG